MGSRRKLKARRAVLYTPIWWVESERRRNEFLTCIKRNAANTYFEHIFVFRNESQKSWNLPEFPHLEVIGLQCRPRFQHFFQHANTELPPGSLVVIANADIYFDETIRAATSLVSSQRFLAISRREIDHRGRVTGLERWWSQDVWILQTPVPRMIASFGLGIRGCDNRIAFEAERSGLEVRNPALNIAVYHLHSERLPEAVRKIYRGPYRFVPLECMDA
jgi:hypothetical protein